MPDLDQLLTDGLRDLTAHIGPADPGSLANHLADRRARRHRRRLGRRLGVATALVAAVALVVALALPVPDGRSRVAIAPPSSPPGPFASLGPGWHPLDIGPVGLGDAAVWTGTELISVGTPAGSDPGVPYEVQAYDPAMRTARLLPPAPLSHQSALGLVWTGTEVVAVGATLPEAEAAAYDPRSNTWRSIGSPPLAPPLHDLFDPLEAVFTSPTELTRASRAAGAGTALLWTGQRVLDFTHGATWDPATGEWAQLALPDGLSPGSVYFSPPVWDGTHAVSATWSAPEALAWDGTGSILRTLPGAPHDRFAGGTTSFAIPADGRVVLVTGGVEGRVVSLDATTGTWRDEPSLGGMRDDVGCPAMAASIGDRAIVRPCSGVDPVALTGTGWVPFDDRTGFDVYCECVGVWLDAGGDLVSGEGHGLAVWVPPAELAGTPR